MKLLKSYSDVTPEETDFLRSLNLRYVTFSSDDSVKQDKRFMEILDKYGALCTFNINTGRLSLKEPIEHAGKAFSHDTISEEDIRNGFYGRHEVAGHTLHHPRLTDLSYSDQLKEIADDAENIYKMTGVDPIGMAYPGGGYDHNDDTLDILANHTRLKYARTIAGTGAFGMPKRFLEWGPTIWEWDEAMPAFTDRFLKEDISKESKVFYIWGHAYEVDFFPEKIPVLEQCLEILSKDPSVVFVTNRVLYKIYCDRIKP